jgi:hypothetical protein
LNGVAWSESSRGTWPATCWRVLHYRTASAQHNLWQQRNRLNRLPLGRVMW